MNENKTLKKVKVKIAIILYLLSVIAVSSYAQFSENLVATIGFRKGYTTLVGAEIEYLVKKIGFEIGGGYEGYGAAINFHFDRDIHSSAFKVFYAKTNSKLLLNPHQIGMAVNLRFARFLSLHLGAAYTISNSLGVGGTYRVVYPIGIGYYRVLNFAKQ